LKDTNPLNAANNSPLGDGGKQYNMFYGADPILFEKAEELRASMTQAEEIFWNVIKINQWHLKFRRQHPIANYIADFYCHQVKLVIELDGGYHENKAVKIYDEARENHIRELGITVLNKIDTAIPQIKTNTTKEVDSSNTSPLGDGGKASLSDKEKLFVIKIGGNVIDDAAALQSFLTDFASIKAKKILVHGGGKIATKIGEQLGIQSNYINGRRITDEATIDLVTMVYGGLVNKKVVAQLQALQCNAIGLTGADANIIPATKRPIIYSPSGTANKNANSSNNSPSGDGGKASIGDGGIDYGFVGDVVQEQISSKNLEVLLANNFTLVIAPLTHDGKGQILNTNADTVASSLAVALSGRYDVRLIYCFEKNGVLENVEDDNSVITLITKEKYNQLLADKKLFDGILPKIDNAFAAINSGVKEVLIGHAKDLLQNVTTTTKGTLIK
jgi:acetylglutamate kinase